MEHFVLEMKGLIKQTQAPFGSIKVKLCQQKYRKCQLERFSLAWSGDPVHTRGSSPNKDSEGWIQLEKQYMEMWEIKFDLQLI